MRVFFCFQTRSLFTSLLKVKKMTIPFIWVCNQLFIALWISTCCVKRSLNKPIILLLVTLLVLAEAYLTGLLQIIGKPVGF
jgi:hypothetical protein